MIIKEIDKLEEEFSGTQLFLDDIEEVIKKLDNIPEEHPWELIVNSPENVNEHVKVDDLKDFAVLEGEFGSKPAHMFSLSIRSPYQFYLGVENGWDKLTVSMVSPDEDGKRIFKAIAAFLRRRGQSWRVLLEGLLAVQFISGVLLVMCFVGYLLKIPLPLEVVGVSSFGAWFLGMPPLGIIYLVCRVASGFVKKSRLFFIKRSEYSSPWIWLINKTGLSSNLGKAVWAVVLYGVYAIRDWLW